MAGILAANGDNKTGISGVALNPILYGFETEKDVGKLYPVTRNLHGDEFGNMTVLAFLIENGVKVINYSQGYSMENSAAQRSAALSSGRKGAHALLKLLQDHDFVIVTSAGNGESANKDALYNNPFTSISSVSDMERLRTALLLSGRQRMTLIQGILTIYLRKNSITAPASTLLRPELIFTERFRPAGTSAAGRAIS